MNGLNAMDLLGPTDASRECVTVLVARQARDRTSPRRAVRPCLPELLPLLIIFTCPRLPILIKQPPLFRLYNLIPAYEQDNVAITYSGRRRGCGVRRQRKPSDLTSRQLDRLFGLHARLAPAQVVLGHGLHATELVELPDLWGHNRRGCAGYAALVAA